MVSLLCAWIELRPSRIDVRRCGWDAADGRNPPRVACACAVAQHAAMHPPPAPSLLLRRVVQ